jgi:hypothetical protein
MKKATYLLTVATILGVTGCELGDKIEEAAKKLYAEAKEKYAEYHGEGQENEPKPFKVVYQNDPNARQVLISASCGANHAVEYVYYTTPADTVRTLHDTQHFISYPGNEKPYWDIRYVDPVSVFINNGSFDHYPDHGTYTGLDVRTGVRNIGIGTAAAQVEAGGGITQSECVDGLLAGGATINLYNAPDQYIHYGGPQSTFTYQLGNSSLSYPWKADGSGNLAIQASFDVPLYFNYGNNIGGSVSFGVYLKNRRTGVVLNYIIGLYAAGEAWIKEKRGIQFDPTTRFIHVATVVSDESWWSTNSLSSTLITEVFPSPNVTTKDDGQWPHFFRVNIAYQNLQALLQELNTNPPAGAENQSFGLDPSEWAVTAINIQYELDEEGGKATLSGSFRGFEAYISQLPI